MKYWNKMTLYLSNGMFQSSNIPFRSRLYLVDACCLLYVCRYSVHKQSTLILINLLTYVKFQETKEHQESLPFLVEYVYLPVPREEI